MANNDNDNKNKRDEEDDKKDKKRGLAQRRRRDKLGTWGSASSGAEVRNSRGTADDWSDRSLIQI